MRLLLEYRCFMKKASLFALTIVFLLWPLVLAAQTELLPMDHQLNARLARSLYSTNRPVHSSIQPYEFGAIAGGNNVDSLLSTGRVWDTTETNWLTRNAPNALLFGTLKQTAPFLKDDARLAVWSQMFDAAMAALKTEDQLRIGDRQAVAQDS